MYSYIVIDDESLIRKGTIKKLSPLSDQIQCIGEAEDGKTGITLIEELHPDIVIIDMQMPVMDGTQLLPYLSEHYPDIPLIVISGYKDFDYVSHALKAKAIDYILKPFSKEDIQKAVLCAIRKIHDALSYQNLLISEEQAEQNYYEYDIQMIQNMIMGYHTSFSSASSKRLAFINKIHSITLLTLYFSVPVDAKEVELFIDDNDLRNLALYIPHMNDSHTGHILLFLPDKSPVSSIKLIQQIAEEFQFRMESQNTTVIIGVSSPYTSLSDLHTAFVESSEALNSQPLSATGFQLFFFSDSLQKHFINWSRQEEFLFRIESGANHEVRHLTNELFDFYSSIEGCTLADVKYHCQQLCTQCQQILSGYLDQDKSLSDSPSMRNVVNSIFSINELKTYYLQFFLNITEMLKNQSVYAIDDTVEKIRIYIQRNYQKNLTQDFIACLFYLNRSYMSTLFRKQTGQKFVDYLNQVRIEKAKTLLKNTDKKMYQIAKSVGYDNVKYFFRIFKKREKMTPEEYRKA